MILEAIKSALMEDLPFFNNGFIDVRRTNAGVVVDEGREDVLFPADHLGSYFYIRPTGSIAWTSDGRAQYPYILVAYLEGLDSQKVLDGILTILRRCNDFMIKVTKASLDNVDVVKSEVGILSVEAALANLRRSCSLLMLNFTATMPLTFRVDGCCEDFKKDSCL